MLRRQKMSAADRNRWLELGRAVCLHREEIRRDQGRQSDLGRSQGRTPHRLLPHRKAAQSRAIAVDRFHRVMFPGQDRTRFRGLDPGGGDHRRVKLRRHPAVTIAAIQKAGRGVRPAFAFGLAFNDQRAPTPRHSGSATNRAARREPASKRYCCGTVRLSAPARDMPFDHYYAPRRRRSGRSTQRARPNREWSGLSFAP